MQDRVQPGMDPAIGSKDNGSGSNEGFCCCLPAGKIGDVHKSVVEGSVDVSDAENSLALADLRSKADLGFLLLLLLSFTRSHGSR